MKEIMIPYIISMIIGIIGFICTLVTTIYVYKIYKLFNKNNVENKSTDTGSKPTDVTSSGCVYWCAGIITIIIMIRILTLLCLA